MKKLLLTSILLTSLSYANNLENVLKDKDIYFSVKAGYSHLHSKKQNEMGNVELLNSQQKSAENISLEIGYAKSENIDYSINYEKVNTKDVDFDNIYLNVKYKFPQDKFTPYVGVNLGYSQMQWNKNPIESKENDIKSSSYLIGLNTGILYDLGNKASIVLNYAISKLDHETNLEPTSSKISSIEHDYLQTFSLGFRKSF